MTNFKIGLLSIVYGSITLKMVSWALHIVPTPDLRRAEQSSKVGDLHNNLIRRCFSSQGDTITLQIDSPALRLVLTSGNRLTSAKLTNDKFRLSLFRFPTISAIRTFSSRSRWSGVISSLLFNFPNFEYFVTGYL